MMRNTLPGVRSGATVGLRIQRVRSPHRLRRSTLKFQCLGFQRLARSAESSSKAIGYLIGPEMGRARRPYQRVLGMVAAVWRLSSVPLPSQGRRSVVHGGLIGKPSHTRMRECGFDSRAWHCWTSLAQLAEHGISTSGVACSSHARGIVGEAVAEIQGGIARARHPVKSVAAVT